MQFGELIRAVAALALTLGLFGLGVVLLRRYGPKVFSKLQERAGGERRLAVVESVMLDPQRRLVLVRLDGKERLILLGEGRLLEGPADV